MRPDRLAENRSEGRAGSRLKAAVTEAVRIAVVRQAVVMR